MPDIPKDQRNRIIVKGKNNKLKGIKQINAKYYIGHIHLKSRGRKSTKIITDSILPPQVETLGRDDDIKEIRSRAAGKLVLLNGIGGIGKTTICREIYDLYCKKPTDGVEYLGWVLYHDSLAASFAAARINNISQDGVNRENYLSTVKSFLNHCGKKLLLFVDNANEIRSDEVLWLDSLSCRLILTSRTRINDIPNYEVRFLPPEVCLSVYQQNSGDKSQESVPFIEEIIQRAAYHTQTVVLLARTQANSGLTAQQFLEKLNEKGFVLDNVRERVKSMHANGKDGAYQLTNERLIEHLGIIFDIAAINDPEQKRTLQLFSLLAANTPVEMVLLKEWFDLESLDAINDLAARGWLDKEMVNGKYCVSIHPVIAETVQYKCRLDYAFAEPLIKSLTDAMNASIGEGVAVQNALLPHCVSVDKSLQNTETNDYARFLDRIAWIMRETGDYDRALSYGKGAVAVAEKVNGTEHLSTAAIYCNFGLVYQDTGDYDKALEYALKDLAITEKVLGTEHPDTAATYHNIGLFYQDIGDYNKALEYYNKAMAIREKVLGTEHPDTATTYNNIANVYKDMGDYDNALKYHEIAKATREKVLGTEHLDTAITYYNFGDLFRETGKTDDALQYAERARKIFEQKSGTDHTNTAMAYNLLARIYLAKNDANTAHSYAEQARNIYAKKGAADHPDAAIIFRTLAEICLALDDVEHAKGYAELAEVILEKKLGKVHSDTRKTYQVLASIYEKSGDTEKAADFRKKAKE